MQCESALIGADVEGNSMGVVCGCSVILALVEKRACLLAGAGIVVKLETVEEELCLQFELIANVKSSRVESHIHLFEFANTRIGPLDDYRWMESFFQDIGRNDADGIVVERFGEQLHNDQVRILVDNEARQCIGLAEDETARVGVGAGEHFAARANCSPQTVCEQLKPFGF